MSRKYTLNAVLVLGIMAVFSIIIAACGSVSSSAPNQVHMNDSRFVQETITIRKGETVTLVNDVFVVHVIANGTWDEQGTPKPGVEEGAPKVDVNVGGNGIQEIGPFNMAGTFQLYCIPHPGMNLTVIVTDD